MIDSHCHLADKAFKNDLEAVLSRAEQAGVSKMVCIADDLKEAKKGLEIAGKYQQIYCTAGVHPHCAKDWAESSIKLIKEMVESSKKVVAIGEIGLDYYYDNSPREVQRSVFLKQLELAKQLNLPAVIHCREAIEDLKRIINQVKPAQLVLHCCTEKWEDVEELVEQGYWLSFTGIATYPKAIEIRRTIKECPLEQIMIETDSPYLAPVPHRGKCNEPAFVVEVAKCVAEVKGMPVAEVDTITTKNTVEFFSL